MNLKLTFVEYCVEFYWLWPLLFMVGTVCFYRDLGVHIDGYIAVVGHTIVVGASKVKFEFLIFNLHINLLAYYVQIDVFPFL